MLLTNMTQRYLKKLQDFFSMQPIEKAWIFGSFARGEESPESDVDILVRYTQGTVLGLLVICELIEKLEDLLGRRVDLVEEGTLFPRVAKQVDAEKLQIYERVS